MVAREVEVLLMVGGIDVDRGMEAKLVNIKENYMGKRDGKSDRKVTVEVLKEKEKEIMAMGINKPEAKIRFRVLQFQKVLYI